MLRLSRGMTYKAAAAGLDLGRRQGRHHRRPQAGQDRGALPRVRPVHRDARRPLHHGRGRRHRSSTTWTSSARRRATSPASRRSWAARATRRRSPRYGVSWACRPAWRSRWAASIRSKGRRVAVQGVGNVGYHLVKHLRRGRRANVVVADIDVDAGGAGGAGLRRRDRRARQDLRGRVRHLRAVRDGRRSSATTRSPS